MIKQVNKYSLDEVLNPHGVNKNATKNNDAVSSKSKVQIDVSTLLDNIHLTIGVMAFEKLNEIEIPRITVKIPKNITDQDFNK